MPFLPFLIGIGIVFVTIQKIAENAPIAGATFSVLILLTTIFLWNLSAKKKALQEATRKAIISEFKWTDNIGPLEFERRCAEAMELSGWIAQTTKSTGDQGADVIASKRGMKVILQCKLYSNTVGNKAVQEVFAAKTHLSANFAAVVSNRSYTRSAKELAITTGVLLLDYSQLREANLLFGFPGDGIPPLQYPGGITPSDVTRARRYVMSCVIASLPVFLIGLGFDAAHNNRSSLRSSTSKIDASQLPGAALASAPTKYTLPPVVTNEDTRNTPIYTEGTAAASDLSTIEPEPAELRPIARAAPLPAGLNQTFRDMVLRSGRACATITDHVWVNTVHISLMCDRKLRVAFVQEKQSWRFARTGEKVEGPRHEPGALYRDSRYRPVTAKAASSCYLRRFCVKPSRHAAPLICTAAEPCRWRRERM